jgi:glycosyltransferase involved in cell wall biosynthesis
MKLLHFIYDHPQNPWLGGGGALRVHHLSRLLAERGHEVELVSGKFPGCQETHADRIRQTFVGSPRSYALSTFSFAFAARRLAARRAARFDVVLEDFAPWNPVFTYRLPGVPSVVQVQNYFGRSLLTKYPGVGLPFYFLERSYPRRFQHAIVINEALNERFGIHGQVISMGVSPELLELTAEPGEYVGFLGRLDFHQKGLDVLLEAAHRLQLPVRIAGDGSGRSRLIAALPQHPTVEWMGWLQGPAKVDFLRRARFLVVPSRFEGQNMALLEAAAIGKAAVVTDVKELAYAVTGGFALPCAVNSATALAETIQQLWFDEALLKRLGGRGREFARKVTWPALADAFEHYCAGLAKPGANPDDHCHVRPARG